jgi:hypothetical protein
MSTGISHVVPRAASMISGSSSVGTRSLTSLGVGTVVARAGLISMTPPRTA